MTMAGVCNEVETRQQHYSCDCSDSLAKEQHGAAVQLLQLHRTYKPGHDSRTAKWPPTFSTRNSFSTAAWLDCTMPKLNLKRRKLALQQGAPGVWKVTRAQQSASTHIAASIARVFFTIPRATA